MATVTKRLRKTWAFQDGERSGYLGIEGPVDLHKRISSAIVEAALRIGPLPFLGCSRTNIFEWARGGSRFSHLRNSTIIALDSSSRSPCAILSMLAFSLGSAIPAFRNSSMISAAGRPVRAATFAMGA